jgi:two-component system, chemotaxis family, CheB/CheR fusion protein
VIVDREMGILHFRGQTGRYLEPAPGAASLNLLRMARPGLALDLRTLIHEARKEHRPARKEGLQTTANGGTVTVNIEVHPLGRAHSEDVRFLVLFEEPLAPARPQDEKTEAAPGRAVGEAGEEEVERLRRELHETKATMQSIIEEHETTTEELRASNEEVQSANEELQSTNEELHTVNAEHQNKIIELTEATNDIDNLLTSSRIGTVILDEDLCIRRFSPQAAAVFHLVEGDEGRPLGHLNHRLEGFEPTTACRQVQRTGQVLEHDIHAENGRWYLVRVLPYQVGPHSFAGVVLTLIDITPLREARAEIGRLQSMSEEQPS